jgi:hypothetical protein
MLVVLLALRSSINFDLRSLDVASAYLLIRASMNVAAIPSTHIVIYVPEVVVR